MGDCRNKWAGYIAGVLNYCGKYSLYMFLYHRLMLDYLLPRIDLEGIIKVILYFAVMVAVSIGMKMGYDMLWSVQNNRKDFGRE